MTLIILGLILWVGAHVFKRVLPEQRARMGEPGKGLVTALLVVSIILMVLGYRGADFIPVWQPSGLMVGLNNVLMLLALWAFGSSAAKGKKAWPATQIRHPQLEGFSLWAAAHLVANGDLASMVLFGGLLLWAQASIRIINAAEPDWTPPEPAGRATYIRLAVITVVLFLVITGIHSWLGVWPFPS